MDPGKNRFPAPMTTSSGQRPPGAPRRRKGRGGRKKKSNRRRSFAVQDGMPQDGLRPEGLEEARDSFFSLQSGNMSGTSIDSETLLDHRDQHHSFRPRRPSMLGLGSTNFQSQQQTPQSSRLRTVHSGDSGNEDELLPWDEGAPLLSQSIRQRSEPALPHEGYGSNDGQRRPKLTTSRSRASSRSSHRRGLMASSTFQSLNDNYNVNYPPSVPGTPPMRASGVIDMSFGDAMIADDLDLSDHSPRGSPRGAQGEGLPFQPPQLERRHTIALQAEEDVCFPHEGLSELGDDLHLPDPAAFRDRPRRRRRKWPDLAILEEWSRFEKASRSEELRAKKITEPQLVNGRLRAVNKGWYRTEEDAPYRFTYFNEEFQSTIHSHNISGLVQEGGNFRELFLPDPPLLSDSEDSGDEDHEQDQSIALHQVLTGENGESRVPTRQPSLATASQGYMEAKREEARRDRALSPSNNGDAGKNSKPSSKQGSGDHTPADVRSPKLMKSPTLGKRPKPPKFGERPVWWLDILSPTEAEMKIIAKAFGIHPLTAEDIMMQEQREKVELFRHYYFVNYRSFDQDKNSEDFLEPVNMYVVVFREGVLSFHFSMTPHPANVRRRVRQLSDYLVVSSDWISYAIIDDITDVFVPLIQSIEDEVDDIDDAILRLHSLTDPSGGDSNKKDSEKKSEAGDPPVAESGRDMLRRVGDCRKRVMMLYRLLGNKADVIKGFAKRCNEHWEVAPRSEIGLYLGDIQDHIVTMTANLSHYEMILSRSHANYLAQINIRMNERAEQTADVLGKLTVLGTIVLPMNIVTGLWGMNVWVPGQEYEGDLWWFLVITAGLLLFGFACYLIAKRVYRIV